MGKQINRYKISMVLFGLVCMVLSVLFFKFKKDNNYLYTITVPFDWLGQGLRNLSLSGTAGNIMAWIIYILIGITPLGVPVYRLIHKKKPIIADAICVLTGMYILFYLFILINPAFLTNIFYEVQNPDKNGELDKYILFTLLVSFIFTAVIFYAMRETSQKRLLEKIKFIVLLLAYLGIFSICFIAFSKLLTSMSTAQVADNANLLSGLTDYKSVPSSVLSELPGYNPGPSTETMINYLLTILRFISGAVPILFLIRIVPPVLKLLFTMEENSYSSEIVIIAKLITKRTKTAIGAILFCSLGFNLIQLLFAHYFVSIHIDIVIPLAFILIAFVMLFLTKYFSQSNLLHDENQQFV